MGKLGTEPYASEVERQTGNVHSLLGLTYQNSCVKNDLVKFESIHKPSPPFMPLAEHTYIVKSDV